MTSDPFHYLGKIIKPNGNKGYVLIELDTDFPGDLHTINSVHLELDGEMIPFQTEFQEIRNNGKAVVRLIDCNSVEEAGALAGKKIFITSSLFPKLDDDHLFFQEIIGYTVTDKKLGKIGIVGGVLEMQYQSLLKVVDEKNEILIPMVPEILTSIDRNLLTIFIDAPEGLIGIYR